MDTEAELRGIERILTESLGRPSRWSGRVELTDNPDIRGAKPFRCDIVINRSLLGQDERWRTLIHEMLHSYSVGYQLQVYQDRRGWEEAVIEQLQRLLRPEILLRLGIAVDAAVFVPDEGSDDYNKFIAALEALRVLLSGAPVPFYLSLLAVPIAERDSFLYNLGMRLPPDAQRAFIAQFSKSRAMLNTRRV